MQDDLIAVTQADREARKRFYDLSECGLSTGDMDLLDRILSTHRQQAEDAMRERCAAELDQRAEEVRVAAIGGGMDPMDASLLDYEYSHAAGTIRATPPKPDRLNGEGE